MPHLRILLSLCVAAAGAAAQSEEATLARLLPPGTAVLLEAHVPTPEEQKLQAAYRCLEEPALKRALERMTGEGSQLTSRTIPLGPSAVVLQPDMTGGAVLKYFDPTGERKIRFHQHFGLAWVGMAERPTPVNTVASLTAVDVVASLTVDTDAREAVKVIQRIVAAAILNAQKDKRGNIDAMVERLFSKAKHRETEYAVFQIKEFRFYLAGLGRMLLATTTEERMKDCIDRYLGRGNGSLADDPRHKALLENAAGTGTATTILSIHIDRVFDALASKLPGPVAMGRGVLAQVGLDSVRSMTAVARVDGPGITSTLSVLTEGELRGAARLFKGGKPASFGCLEFAPKETLYVACSNFDARMLFDIFMESGGVAVAAGVAGMMERKFGIKMREDLLDLLGPEAAIVIARSQGLIPDVGLVFESKDPARLNAAIVKMAKAIPWPAGMELQSATIQGTPVHIVPLGHPRLAKFPIAPTFGVVDGRLLIAPYPLSFQRFAAVKRGERPGLKSNRDYAKLRERVPENALGMSYMDLPALTAWAYDTLVPVLQSLPQQQDGPSPFFDLPDVTLITRHLYGRIGWRVADERGMHWVSHSPVDMSGFVLAGMVAAGTVVYFVESSKAVGKIPGPTVPPSPEVRLRDREARVCRSNVRLLRARMRLYAQKHGGRFPATLDELKAPHVAPETFVSPGLDRPYDYCGPNGCNGILLHGHPNGKDGKICVLTTDLEMERVSAEELKARLEPQAAEGSR
jgi:hypothetical protein